MCAQSCNVKENEKEENNNEKIIIKQKGEVCKKKGNMVGVNWWGYNRSLRTKRKNRKHNKQLYDDVVHTYKI